MPASFAELQIENRELHDRITALQAQALEQTALLLLAESCRRDLRAECRVAWELVRDLRQQLKSAVVPAPRRATVKS